jgi:plasmid stabilization system protein ParE
MKTLVFLPSSAADLRWFHHYYRSVFPAGRAKANRQFAALRRMLREMPGVGHASELVEGVLEYQIRNTPFTVIYRVRGEQVQVLRVYDQRSGFANAR